jgi:hypothetical protein
MRIIIFYTTGANENSIKFWSGYLRDRSHLRDIDVSGKIISKLIFE